METQQPFEGFFLKSQRNFQQNSLKLKKKRIVSLFGFTDEKPKSTLLKSFLMTYNQIPSVGIM